MLGRVLLSGRVTRALGSTRCLSSCFSVAQQAAPEVAVEPSSRPPTSTPASSCSSVLSRSDMQKGATTTYDYFGVESMVTLEQLFNARCHLGHYRGVVDESALPFVYGERAYQHIIDLNITLKNMKVALHFLSNIVYKNGVVCFVSGNPKFDYLIQKTARECSEYFVTRSWKPGTFADVHNILGTSRIPDLVIAFNFSRFEKASRLAVRECEIVNIPTIGICDTDCDPTSVTFPIPGNDDTMQSMQLYCDLFNQAIVNAKRLRDIDRGLIVEDDADESSRC